MRAAGDGDMTRAIRSRGGSKDAFWADITPYESGSDHWIYQEGGFAIPSIYLRDHPDIYIHTTGDIADNIEPTKIKRSAFIAAASGYYLATMPDRGAALLRLSYANAHERLAEDGRRAVAMAHESGGRADAANIVAQAVLREQRRICVAGALRRWQVAGPRPVERRHRGDRRSPLLAIVGADEAERTAASDFRASSADRRVPVRNADVKGPLTPGGDWLVAKGITAPLAIAGVPGSRGRHVRDRQLHGRQPIDWRDPRRRERRIRTRSAGRRCGIRRGAGEGGRVFVQAMRHSFVAAGFFAATMAAGAPPTSDIEPGLLRALTGQFAFTPSDSRGYPARKNCEANAGGDSSGRSRRCRGPPSARLKAGVRQPREGHRQLQAGRGVLQIGTFGRSAFGGRSGSADRRTRRFRSGSCRVHDCDIRIPADAIRRIQQAVAGSGGHEQARAASEFKQILAAHVRAYLDGGNGPDHGYDDGTAPISRQSSSPASSRTRMRLRCSRPECPSTCAIRRPLRSRTPTTSSTGRRKIRAGALHHRDARVHRYLSVGGDVRHRVARRVLEPLCRCVAVGDGRGRCAIDGKRVRPGLREPFARQRAEGRLRRAHAGAAEGQIRPRIYAEATAASLERR